MSKKNVEERLHLGSEFWQILSCGQCGSMSEACNVDMDDEDRTIIFIVEEDMYKQVCKGIKNSYNRYRFQPFVLTYVPSLVHIQKKEVRLDLK